MHRILFQIGPVTIYSYGMLMAIAFIVSSACVILDAKRQGIEPGKMLDILMILILSGILGARLLFVIQHWKSFAENFLKVFMLYEGGLAFQGALAGAVIGGMIAAKTKNIRFWKGADIIAPYIPLGQAIGRIGCFLNGCCYGKVTQGGIGIVFPGETAARIPAQLYSSLFLCGLCVLLVIMKQKKKFEGYLFSMYLMMYGVLRFFLDFIRADTPEIFLNLKLSQIISIGIFLAGVFMYTMLSNLVKKVPG